MKILLAPRALREAERCARWWRDNRPAARFLFDEELEATLGRLRVAPDLGTRYQAVPGVEHRRLLMPRTRHHVYYQVAPDQIRIVAIWSAVRGRRPRLR